MSKRPHKLSLTHPKKTSRQASQTSTPQISGGSSWLSITPGLQSQDLFAGKFVSIPFISLNIMSLGLIVIAHLNIAASFSIYPCHIIL